MFRAPPSPLNSITERSIRFYTTYIYCRVCLFKTYQNIYTFACKISAVLEHLSIKLKNQHDHTPPSIKWQGKGYFFHFIPYLATSRCMTRPLTNTMILPATHSNTPLPPTGLKEPTLLSSL